VNRDPAQQQEYDPDRISRLQGAFDAIVSRLTGDQKAVLTNLALDLPTALATASLFSSSSWPHPSKSQGLRETQYGSHRVLRRAGPRSRRRRGDYANQQILSE
jgi:hypothetical protein